MNVGTIQSAVAFLEPSTGIPGIFNATAVHTHTHTHIEFQCFMGTFHRELYMMCISKQTVY